MSDPSDDSGRAWLGFSSTLKTILSVASGGPGAEIVSLINDAELESTKRSFSKCADFWKEEIERLWDRIDADTINRDEFAELFKSCHLTTVRTQQEEKLSAAIAIVANSIPREGDPEKLQFTELDHFAKCIDQLSAGAIELISICFEVATKANQRARVDGNLRMNFCALQAKQPIRAVGTSIIVRNDLGTHKKIRSLLQTLGVSNSNGAGFGGGGFF